MPVKNICRCPDQPGDYVECSKDQMALCIIEDGIVRRVCQDVIKDTSDLTIVNYALSTITGIQKIYSDYVTDTDISLLRSGEYNQGDYLKVTFSLPEKILNSLDNIDRNRGLLLR